MPLLTTNEELDNEANRRIPITFLMFLYECFGNLSGDHIAQFYDKKIHTFFSYSNDGGFRDIDKKAMIKKKDSGEKEGTCSINGLGLRLVTDRSTRLIKERDNEPFFIYSKSREGAEVFKGKGFQCGCIREKILKLS